MYWTWTKSALPLRVLPTEARWPEPTDAQPVVLFFAYSKY